METAKSLREDYLQQNAFDDVKRRSKALGTFSELMAGTVEIRDRIARSKYLPEEELEKLDRLQAEIKTTIKKSLLKEE